MTFKILVALMLLSAKSVSAIELVSDSSPLFAQAVKNKVLMAGIELVLVNDGNEKVIAPTHVLKSGEQFRLRLRTSIDSHYQLYLLDKKGNRLEAPRINGDIKAANTLRLPQLEDGIFQLDSKPGIEWLELVIVEQTNKAANVLNKHPHGKLEQIILRNVEVLSPPEQKLNYDPVGQVIYISHKKPRLNGSVLSLKLGLNHSNK